MKTILVLGATGFVGSHTLEFLMSQSGVKVIAACRSSNKLNPNFDGEIREGNIRDDKYLLSLFEGVDVVINAMAWTSLWGHKQQSEEMFLKPSIRLIDVFSHSKAQRFVNVSTISAAAPEHSSEPMSYGLPRRFWPHLCNVIRIENELRNLASANKAVVNLRLGLFAGKNYALGLLPILVPRMKTHLVPWVARGQTGMPIIDGRDIAQAMGLAATSNRISGFESFNIVGPCIPKVREVIDYLAEHYHLPRPHFSVPFFIAYPFAWLMEKIDPLVPWEPLIVRSIIHLLEETHANNDQAEKVLGYQPKYHWQQAINVQMEEMLVKQQIPMKMAKPIA